MWLLYNNKVTFVLESQKYLYKLKIILPVWIGINGHSFISTLWIRLIAMATTLLSLVHDLLATNNDGETCLQEFIETVNVTYVMIYIHIVDLHLQIYCAYRVKDLFIGKQPKKLQCLRNVMFSFSKQIWKVRELPSGMWSSMYMIHVWYV